MNSIILISIIGSSLVLSLIIIISSIYYYKKLKRNTWQLPTTTQSVTNSAPISRRSSATCLINLDKSSTSSRSRSASFGEDLTARLQIIASAKNYHSYSSAKPILTPNSSKPLPVVNQRTPIVSNISSSVPEKPITPSITFKIRYEQTLETLFITIFQLQNYLPTKTTQTVFIILYLLPNDDEQKQMPSSLNGVFNSHCNFSLKAEELVKRTLRLSVYTVDSISRIRDTLGHVFIKLDQFVNDNQNDKTFSTHTLNEYVCQDLQIRSNYLGELVLTNSYFKDQNLVQIRIHEINHLNIEQMKNRSSLKAHFSGQISGAYNKDQWINTSSFTISSSSTVCVNQELNLTIRSTLFSTNDDNIECHLRLYLNDFNQIHSHARWQYSLRSNSSKMLTVPLIAL